MTNVELRPVLDRPEIAPVPSKTLVVQAIYRHRWKMLLIMATVFGLVAVWTFVTPKRYTSEMFLLVQNVRGAEVVTSGTGSDSSRIADVTQDQLNSEISVLNSDDVANGVIDPSWTPNSANTMTRAQLRTLERAIHVFRKRLEVSPIRDSYVIDVRFTADSPQAAHNTLTQLLQVFLRKQRDLDRLPGAAGVFADEANEYQRELQKARQDLSNYQENHGFISAQDQESALQIKLIDAQSAERDTYAQIAEISDRILADKRQIAKTSKRLATARSLSPSAGAIDQLSLLLVSLENKRTALLTKYVPTDRLVQEVDQQIKETNEGLTRASRLSAHEVFTDVNPLYEATERDLDSSTVALAAARAKGQSLSAQAGELQSQVGGVESTSTEYDSLTERIAELQGSYRAFVAKRDAAQMDDLMDEQKWLNIAVVQYPTMSIFPSHPTKFLNLLLGLFSAIVLSGCTVLLFETLRQQVATAEELRDLSAYSVLATIPFDSLDSSSPRGRHTSVTSQLEAKG